MPINTLNNRTTTGQNTGTNNFATFQTQLANIKAQKPQTALSNVFTQARNTNKNIKSDVNKVQGATDTIRNTWSDANIDKGLQGIHDNFNTKFKGIFDTFNTGTDKVEGRKTISFAGSPSDEEIKGLINRSTTAGSGGLNAATMAGNQKLIDADLADDGILNSPEVVNIMQGILGNSIALTDGGGTGTDIPASAPSDPLYNDPRNWGALTQQWMTDINSDNAQIRATALENLTKLADYGILDDIIKQDTWGDKNAVGTSETDAFQTALGLEQANPSNLGNAYALLGGRDSGNAFMNALNMETARPEILDSISKATGTAQERALAEEEFRSGQKTYMDTVREREQAYRTKADATTLDINKDKAAIVAAIEDKYKKLGYTPAQIADKVKTMTGNQASVNQNEADRIVNEKAYADYMDKVKTARTASDKKIAENKLKAINEEFVAKTNMPPEKQSDLEKYIEATTPEGEPKPTLEQAQSTLESLTDEALDTYIKNYGNAAKSVDSVGDVLTLLDNIPGFRELSLFSGIGGKIAAKILEGKLKKYQTEKKRREDEAIAKKKADEKAAQDAIDAAANIKATEDAKIAAAKKAGSANWVTDYEPGDGDSNEPKAGSEGSNKTLVTGSTGYTHNGTHYSGIGDDQR